MRVLWTNFPVMDTKANVMNDRVHYSIERELVSDWAEKWIQLIGLINAVTGMDGPPWSPPPPSDLEELRYQALRFWFIDHQAQFLPLWEDFYEEWASRQDNDNEYTVDLYSDNDITELPDMEAYLENPFLFFYRPENLYQLAQQLALQSGIDIWEPSEHYASMIRPLMIHMGKIMIEFIDWIDERVCE